MQNIAEFRIIGRVGKISEHDKVTKVNVAANYNRQENGEWVTDTHWNEVTLFGKLIERGGKAQKGPVGPKLRFWSSRRTFWERGIRY